MISERGNLNFIDMHPQTYMKDRKIPREGKLRVCSMGYTTHKHRNTHLLFCITVLDGLQDRYTLPQTVRILKFFVASKNEKWKNEINER